MRKLSIGFMVVVIAFVAGCSDDDSPTGGGGAVDTTPPGVTGVVAVDANHLQVTFSEAVKKATAERPQSYVIVEISPSATAGSQSVSSPGDTVHVGTAVLGSDGVTVTVTTFVMMGNLPYQISVTDVEDLSGNKITDPVMVAFTGSNAGDTTPPEIVLRSPAPGATGTGIAEPVVVQFSEPMDDSSVRQAFQWTWASGMVSWEMEQQGDNTFVFRPLQALLNTTTFTASIQGSAQDWAGNGLAGGPTSWIFTTTATPDNTPPTLLSSVPANGTANVAVTTILSLTFSEPVDQTAFDDVFITPEPGDGVASWSNGGQTVTFVPDSPLLDDTQYTLVLLPGAVFDLAGNANTQSIQVAWTTGASFESGRFSGTIAGDPNSSQASDPNGALVVAAKSNPFTNDDFDIGGTATVGVGGLYSVMNLADGTYYPLCALDSNGDGELDPDMGDAFGAYGVEFGVDDEPDPVDIVGGSVETGINFPLFDPIAISGTVSYNGGATGSFNYYVLVFDTTGFDVDNLPLEDFSTSGSWPFDPDYSVDELDEGLQPGTYYVGAFLDLDFNGNFDDGVDAGGLYETGGEPIPVTLANGGDALDVDILMEDTTGMKNGFKVSRQRASRPEHRATAAQRVAGIIRQALERGADR